MYNNNVALIDDSNGMKIYITHSYRFIGTEMLLIYTKHDINCSIENTYKKINIIIIYKVSSNINVSILWRNSTCIVKRLYVRKPKNYHAYI